jgi:sec-independent protein translocase protein TatA
MGASEWIWVIIVIAVIFGASRLPSIGRNVGVGIKEFKRGIADASRDDGDAKTKPAPSGEDRGTTA